MPRHLRSVAAGDSVPPSNRRGTRSKTDHPTFGVDRLAVSWPVRSYEPDPSAWSTVSTRNPGTDASAETRSGSVEVNGRKVFVGVQQVGPTGQTWAKVEVNPSRIVDPEGHSLAPVSVLPSVMSDVLKAAAELVEEPEEHGSTKVRRIDVARDFEGVQHPEFFVRGLGPVQRPWARRNLVHFDPTKKGAQTLMVGSGAGVVRLYDKDAETGGKTPGVLRWETEARRSWAQNYGGIDVLADVSRASVEALALNRWEWSAMGVEVSATSRVIEKVQRSGLTPAQQRNFLGHLLLQSAGMEAPGADRTSRRWAKLQRDIGVSLVHVESDHLGFVARLDWQSGREVVRAA